MQLKTSMASSIFPHRASPLTIALSATSREQIPSASISSFSLNAPCISPTLHIPLISVIYCTQLGVKPFSNMSCRKIWDSWKDEALTSPFKIAFWVSTSERTPK
ncbi:hypothetical protein CIPAW_06G016600 [Carya illinoinensis]|uniref:Uncharacterized protein n=1 Tax=Carya illinoinensis TaxID=32201 RepID=A0A8T1Q687_CARIL|nr:hypothetical protein CIPAW_06G016600 [Carya illinoinensis]